MDDLTLWIGAFGVFILLAAFFLNTFGRLRPNSIAYAAANLIGAMLNCWASYQINYLPFVILEAVWALVALVALARIFSSKKEHRLLY
ncbi:MAG: hypothetical protein WC588_00500 [Candidatus Micrarchaeia archaeon]